MQHTQEWIAGRSNKSRKNPRAHKCAGIWRQKKNANRRSPVSSGPRVDDNPILNGLLRVVLQIASIFWQSWQRVFSFRANDLSSRTLREVQDVF